MTALPLAAFWVVFILGACGRGAEDVVEPQRDTSHVRPLPPAPPIPPLPPAFDLRFKGVGVLSGNHLELLSATTTTMLGGGAWWTFGRAAGSPLSLGSGICSTQSCGWSFFEFALPNDIARVATAYRAALIVDLPRFISTAVDTVITSLDLQPTVGVFALSEFAASRLAGYHLTQLRVPLSGLQAAASDEGAAKRVITAVSFDSGQVRCLSYAWDYDDSHGYEATVVQATLQTAGAAAQALAAEGYVITALGGNPTGGFVLVGTRPIGKTEPRTLLINPSWDTDLNGYAVVGYLYDAFATSARTLLFER